MSNQDIRTYLQAGVTFSTYLRKPTVCCVPPWTSCRWRWRLPCRYISQHRSLRIHSVSLSHSPRQRCTSALVRSPGVRRRTRFYLKRALLFFLRCSLSCSSLVSDRGWKEVLQPRQYERAFWTLKHGNMLHRDTKYIMWNLIICRIGPL